MRRIARRTATQVHIGRMVKRIVKKFDPEQIILVVGPGPGGNRPAAGAAGWWLHLFFG